MENHNDASSLPASAVEDWTAKLDLIHGATTQVANGDKDPDLLALILHRLAELLDTGKETCEQMTVAQWEEMDRKMKFIMGVINKEAARIKREEP